MDVGFFVIGLSQISSVFSCTNRKIKAQTLCKKSCRTYTCSLAKCLKVSRKYMDFLSDKCLQSSNPSFSSHGKYNLNIETEMPTDCVWNIHHTVQCAVVQNVYPCNVKIAKLLLLIG